MSKFSQVELPGVKVNGRPVFYQPETKMLINCGYCCGFVGQYDNEIYTTPDNRQYRPQIQTAFNEYVESIQVPWEGKQG